MVNSLRLRDCMTVKGKVMKSAYTKLYGDYKPLQISRIPIHQAQCHSSASGCATGSCRRTRRRLFSMNSSCWRLNFGTSWQANSWFANGFVYPRWWRISTVEFKNLKKTSNFHKFPIDFCLNVWMTSQQFKVAQSPVMGFQALVLENRFTLTTFPDFSNFEPQIIGIWSSKSWSVAGEYSQFRHFFSFW